MTCPSCPTPVLVALAACVSFLPASVAQELRFQHHYVARDLPVNARGYGDYGLTALVDIDRDGDLDFVCGGRANQPSQLYWFESKAWGPLPWNANQGKMHADCLENLLIKKSSTPTK